MQMFIQRIRSNKIMYTNLLRSSNFDAPLNKETHVSWFKANEIRIPFNTLAKLIFVINNQWCKPMKTGKNM